MCAQVPERDALTVCRNDVQSRALAAQVKARHAQATAVVENQALDRAMSVPDDERRTLLGHRDDSPPRLRRPAAVEDTEFNARHVLLNNGVNGRATQTVMQIVECPGDDHTGPALAFIRFEHNGQRQVLSLQERLNAIALLALGESAGD